MKIIGMLAVIERANAASSELATDCKAINIDNSILREAHQSVNRGNDYCHLHVTLRRGQVIYPVLLPQSVVALSFGEGPHSSLHANAGIVVDERDDILHRRAGQKNALDADVLQPRD